MDVIALSIKSLEQQTKSVSLPRTASVLELKQKIQLEFDIDGTRQRLIFQGKVLRDGKNLSDYRKCTHTHKNLSFFILFMLYL